jgi:hypothetical protein
MQQASSSRILQSVAKMQKLAIGVDDLGPDLS